MGQIFPRIFSETVDRGVKETPGVKGVKETPAEYTGTQRSRRSFN